jgi:hypothetical protein
MSSLQGCFFFMTLQVGNSIQDDLWIILELAQALIAVIAKKAPELTGLMAMV